MKTIKKHILEFFLWFFALPHSLHVTSLLHPNRNVVYILVLLFLVCVICLFIAK